ncbi:hypothetical protein, conserved [Entamoeba dispar SAW760]|uniref:Sulfotransferase n=1 Tax=Entamoeba dispar (strain ATCC PRA-260 / SAW760) TaxID=370354 RepID=B0EJK0_ENTDS|nr:uncharacterized protein EDI_165840 [Entamoeba dispar SAW760]EDR25322.1 hypothetical protein, conserved [Entamoeba dispar SAW760]|eukprot:EDR25322.1 hypothetical protein, conserved [Entamoeba dispar SAW760]
MEFKRADTYTANKESPYYRPLLPEAAFDPIFQKEIQYAVGFLCQMDPSHAELYKTIPSEYMKYLQDPKFKDNFREFFAGCFDPESELFKMVFKNNVVKLASYMRFLKERDMDKEELAKIQIKNPLYIVAMPRSGSTFTHSLFSADPRGQKVAMYEHLNPGSKTMTEEARIKIAEMICGSITQDSQRNFNTVHALNDVRRPEEEMFFTEMLGLTLVFAQALPRLEQYRESVIMRDYDWVYDDIIDEMKMHAIQFPFKSDKEFFCMKCATHFMTPAPFLTQMCKDEYNPRIIWLHREPIGNIKSAILLYWNVRARYEHDIGLDDIKWLNETVIRFNEIMLKNAIAAREQWIAQNPERAKYIYDVGFSEIIAHPKETVQKIYEYFGMEYTNEFDSALKEVIENGHPQKQFGRRQHEENMYTFNPEEVRERFKFHYEKFSQYLPDFWGKKDIN